METGRGCGNELMVGKGEENKQRRWSSVGGLKRE